MCLSTIEETYDKPSSMIFDGWKAFNGSGKNLTFQVQSLKSRQGSAGGNWVPLDQWIKADEPKIKADDGKYYNAGFHVWEDETEAKKYGSSVRRVYTRNVTCKGRQDGLKVLIAQEIYVPSDPSGWPPKAGEPAKKDSSALLDLLEKAKDLVKGGNA